MGRIRLILLLVNIAVTAGGYSAIFGESGYLMRRNLTRELVRIRSQVEELKQEHEILQEQYLMLHSKNGPGKSQDSEIVDAIIMKFDDSSSVLKKNQPVNPLKEGFRGLSFFTSTLLYFLLMSAWTVFSLYFIPAPLRGEESAGMESPFFRRWGARS